jgi:hypothetical protein
VDRLDTSEHAVDNRPAWLQQVEEEATRSLARIVEYTAEPPIISEGSGPDDYQGA